jgi:hypothetical protein
MRVSLPNPQRKRLHHSLLEDEDKDAESQGDAQDEAIHSLIAEVLDIEDWQSRFRDYNDQNGVS